MQCSLRNVICLASKAPLKTNGAILGALNGRFYSTTHEADLVVIGSGPGGYVASIKAAQLGMKTVNIEKYPTLGGTCLNVGCIPSKALLNNSYLYEMAAQGHMADRGINVSGVELDLEKLMSMKKNVVKSLTGGIAQLFKKNKVTQLTGLGTITSPNVVEVTKEDGSKDTINTKNIMIASGSVVTPFPGIEIDEEIVVSNIGALSLKKLPKKMILVGCGIIGVEVAAVWARLGSQVIAIDPSLKFGGKFVDREIADAFLKLLTKSGMTFKLGYKIKSAQRTGNEVQVLIEDVKSGQTEELTADCLFIAIGRRPYTENLGLENVQIETDKRGTIPVNERYQTVVPNIYAIGDCIAGAQLAHKAEAEGEAAVEAMNGHYFHVDYGVVPSVVFTNPELAWIGLNEEELNEKNIPFTVGKFPFVANSRARTGLSTLGFVKIYADQKTEKILGVHIMGPSASELINESALIMQYGGTAEDLARVCHAHPTHSEALKEAALAIAFGKPINF
ncbi:dihydrolipoyl dehydrogenase, mitochondrial isoform X2 [Episyrphus balteatus]|uniref:dihydrolipoyl dehydrogenase, mitochondrial isoform X2 n=1 Tax=Episyrphus balteatus TaxID=286459 RepID=UPI00248577B7|nr:dihydrolipoyl dehydrogenase, mitochondrial isoform X2 [Episyrphus balteatus]